MTLNRLVLTFKAGEIVIHAFYRSQDGAGPPTKAPAGRKSTRSLGPACRMPWRPQRARWMSWE
jgi:hypothetical protein